MNSVNLVGRLTKDVELKKTQTGLSVATFTVAVNRRQPKDAQEKQADFISCVAWRGSAEYLENYSTKGSMVGIEGKIQTRNYDGSDGKKVYVTEVLVESVSILSSGKFNKEVESVNDNLKYTDGFQSYPTNLVNDDDLPF